MKPQTGREIIRYSRRKIQPNVSISLKGDKWLTPTRMSKNKMPEKELKKLA
jgi:hypothetical protein